MTSSKECEHCNRYAEVCKPRFDDINSHLGKMDGKLDDITDKVADIQVSVAENRVLQRWIRGLCAFFGTILGFLIGK